MADGSLPRPEGEAIDATSRRQRPDQPVAPSPRGDSVMVLCPYCGSLSTGVKSCSHCGGQFDLLSRQRTQNAMGPWFIRDQVRPFHPGCSYATLRRMIAHGRVRPETVLRGPTTRQFWSFAHNTPGIAHLFGACHACKAPADPGQERCGACGVSFLVAGERQHLGLAPIHLLPGDADATAIAAAAFGDAETPQPEGNAQPQHSSPHQRDTPSNGMATAHNGAPAAADQPPIVQRPRARASRTPWIIAGLAVLLGAAAAGGWHAWNTGLLGGSTPIADSTRPETDSQMRTQSDGSLGTNAADPSPPGDASADASPDDLAMPPVADAPQSDDPPSAVLESAESPGDQTAAPAETPTETTADAMPDAAPSSVPSETQPDAPESPARAPADAVETPPGEPASLYEARIAAADAELLTELLATMLERGDATDREIAAARWRLEQLELRERFVVPIGPTPAQ